MGWRKQPPERMCVVCRARFGQPELARITRVPEADGGALAIDLPRAGRRPRAGRGAYIGARRACWSVDDLARRLGAALKTTWTDDDRARLATFAREIPEEGPPSACPRAGGAGAPAGAIR